MSQQHEAINASEINKRTQMKPRMKYAGIYRKPFKRNGRILYGRGPIDRIAARVTSKAAVVFASAKKATSLPMLPLPARRPCGCAVGSSDLCDVCRCWAVRIA
jgi:hypothetical protein